MLSTRKIFVTSRCRKKPQGSLLRLHSPGNRLHPGHQRLLQQHLPLKQHPAQRDPDNGPQDRHDVVILAVVHGAVTLIAILIDMIDMIVISIVTMIVDPAGGTMTGTVTGACRGVVETLHGVAEATAGACLLAAGTAARGVAEAAAGAHPGATTVVRGVAEAAAGARPGAATGEEAAGGGDSMLIRNRVIE